jgi:trk system potassium uptake protein TrkA
MDLNLPQGVNIGGVIRNGTAMIARGNVHIQAGDKVVAFTVPESANKLMKLFN